MNASNKLVNTFLRRITLNGVRNTLRTNTILNNTYRNFHTGSRQFPHTHNHNKAKKILGLASLIGIGSLFGYYASPFTSHAEFKEESEKQLENMLPPTEEDDKSTKEEEKPLLKFKYIIIGGGTAGHHALKAILENDKELANDKDAKIVVLNAENHISYMRPPLTKELWTSTDPNVAETLKFVDWQGKETTPAYENNEYYESNSAILFLPRARVIDVSPTFKRVLLEDGTELGYQACLIATGGEPRVLPWAKDKKNVTTYRTVDDFRELYQISKSVPHITVVGGGFLGSELAASLAGKVKVTQVFPEEGVLANTLPPYLSEYATKQLEKLGVEVITKKLVKDASEDNQLTVTLDDGQKWSTDHVVVAAGITPSAPGYGKRLEVDEKNGGVVANAELQIRQDLFAAGDVLSYFDATLSTRRRTEHYDHAIKSGQQAGENMVASVGANPDLKVMPYLHQPMFWSSFAGIEFEAVGITDSKLQTIGLFVPTENMDKNNPEYKRGIVYYLRDDKVVGVLLWGVYGKVDEARKLINMKRSARDPEAVKHFISLHEQDQAH